MPFIRHYIKLRYLFSREVMEYKLHVHHIMLFEFRLLRNAAERIRKICSVFPGSIRESQVQRWHKKFKEGNFSVENEQRSCKTIHVDNEDLKELIESEPLEN
ncbi:hypothetical protein TNIN_10601 [Trichonephila inaurata madagascariensis]|uniref:Mos1 transposase HTH domain-containing protein n=1 Tax=Trichonephila inaurata madagascariensis TaxID=2747483 RepID=A0A8X6IX27_9ARAC|nr:hypothetical protein TNIN_10601 [Trichonephila inaurata madagascariensis]